MTNFLVKHFVKNYEDTESIAVRTSYGMLSGIVGILCNVLLFSVKLLIGMILNSISVTADAFNNLSDAGSSIISLVGVKMAGKPADADHPFGHGRIEYIAALIVSFLVIQVGFSFLKDSVGKVFLPEEMSFHLVSVLILAFSIGIKLWLGLFNKALGTRINSKVMMAAATDSIGDVITTGATIVSILIFHFFSLNIDGIIGVLVACVVIWAGIGIARDTLAPLIGTGADPVLYQEIISMVEGYPGIVGSHDLIVHNYGPGRSMASIHAEVPRESNIEDSHETIDRIEREVSKKLGIFLVIHMDPVETRNEKILALKARIEDVVRSLDTRLSIHDFRFVDGKKQINLIFDLVVPGDYDEEMKDDIRYQIMNKISDLDKRFQCVITIDRSFVSEE